MTGWEYYNMDPEVKERLQRKSYWIFKAKHRWRKIIDKLGCSVQDLESQMDGQIELMEKQLQVALSNKLKKEKMYAKLSRKNEQRDARPSSKPSGRKTRTRQKV